MFIPLELHRIQLLHSSGGNHDHCHTSHIVSYSSTKISETSIKSFSPAMGIKSPGFFLLTLSSPSTSSHELSQYTYASQLCLLPSLVNWYSKLYPIFLIMTFIVLIARWSISQKKANPFRTHKSYLSNGLPTSFTNPSNLPRRNSSLSSSHRRSLSLTLFSPSSFLTTKDDPTDFDSLIYPGQMPSTPTSATVGTFLSYHSPVVTDDEGIEYFDSERGRFKQDYGYGHGRRRSRVVEWEIEKMRKDEIRLGKLWRKAAGLVSRIFGGEFGLKRFGRNGSRSSLTLDRRRKEAGGFWSEFVYVIWPALALWALIVGWYSS
jgi:hypothetical protein